MLEPIWREVFEGDNLKLQVLDRSLARSTTHAEPYAVISIGEPQMKPAPLAESPQCKAVLRLHFSDVATDLTRLRSVTHVAPFTPEMAQQIVSFAREQMQNNVRLIVAHCEAGMSRSAGVVSALSQYYNHDETPFLVHYRPNAHVRRLMLEALRADETKLQIEQEQTKP